jgi:hypothetical protein
VSPSGKLQTVDATDTISWKVELLDRVLGANCSSYREYYKPLLSDEE